MTKKEIIEKKQAIAQNDIDHFNQRISEIENEICQLNKQKNSIAQKISRKQIYINQLENDIEKHFAEPTHFPVCDPAPTHDDNNLDLPFNRLPS